jgi:hypothetical protein
LYCGIDLHACTMYVCMLNQDGEIVVHRHLPTSPEAWLKTIAPYRKHMVIAVAWTLHLGPGWLTCVPKKGFRLSWGTRAR